MTRDVAIVTAGRVMQMAVLLVALRTMTHQLSPVEVGTFSILLSIATFFVWLLVSPVGLYVNRRTIDWVRAGSASRNYAIHGAYVATISLLAGLALLLAQSLTDLRLSLPHLLLSVLAGGYIFWSVTSNTITPALNIMGQRIPYTILYTLTQILCLAASWVLTSRHPDGAHWFEGQIVGFAAGAMLSLKWFLRAVGNRAATPSPITLARLRSGITLALTFVIPVALAWGLTWTQFQSYRILVGRLVSLDYLGQFFAGYSVSFGVMGAIEIAGTQFFYPYFYRGLQAKTDASRMDGWRLYIGLLAPLLTLIAASLIATRLPIQHVVLSKRFAHAGDFVAVGALVEAVRVLCGAYALAAHASMRTKSLLLPHSVGAACVLVGLTVGPLVFGASAIPVVMIASAMIFLAVMHHTMLAHSGVTLTFYGIPAVAMGCAALAAIALLQPILPAGLLWDIGVLAIVGVVVLVAAYFAFNTARGALEKIAN